MAYLIRRTDQGGGWLAPKGSAKSYTHNKAGARRFLSRESAEAERCPENEVIEEL